MTVGALLFDLDGTLADTAPDLAAALNATLAAFGRPPLPYERIRPVVSHGSVPLIQLGFGLDPADPGFELRRRYLLDHYSAHICDTTQLFPGMDEVLAELAARNIPWGVVTNKPAWLTEPLLEKLPLPNPPAVVVSGDTCPERKPHPMPLEHACQHLEIAPRAAAYVGDARRDLEAGRAAGMTTVLAGWGYIDPAEAPERWPADLRCDHPQALLDALFSQPGEAIPW